MNPAFIRADEILRRLGDNPRGAELGVAHGQLSSRLLVRPDLHLTMVDSWGKYRETFAPSGDYFATLGSEEQDRNRASAEFVTRFAEKRREIIEADTLEAAKRVEDGSLDFVFVDADHSYDGCRLDIEAWLPKLKAGGLMCGHDYAHPDFPNWDVRRAVDEFAAAHGLTVELGADYTWFVRLPGPYPMAARHYDRIVVACVKWGSRYSAAYVNVLADMVNRNLGTPSLFVCLTDDPEGLDEGIETVPIPRDGLKGWWNKCRLFAPGVFPVRSRILFLDLDVVVTGPLDDLVLTKGIASDWLQGGYNSSVMVWDEGEHRQIWSRLTQGDMARLHGDQDWIGEVSRWMLFPADWVVSYRLHAQEWPPMGAKIVAFHGAPKPHEITSGWVPEMWQMNGLARPRFLTSVNNDVAKMRANVEINKNRNVPSIKQLGVTQRPLSIVGGGPSLADSLFDLCMAYGAGEDVWALNGAHDWLAGKGIVPDAMVMLDSRPENVKFVQDPMIGVKYYIATQCDPAVFDALDGYDVRKWTAWLWGVEDAILIGGGATVGLKAMCLAYVLGYRKFKLFGFDSSFRDGKDHAYEQPVADGSGVTEVVVQGQRFTAAKWMVKQVREFQDLAHTLIGGGCEIQVFGDGLLPTVCKMAVEHAEKPLIAAE